MNTTMIIIILVGIVIISSVIWYIQPRMSSEIPNKTIPIEPKKVFNETKAKEIEKALNNTTVPILGKEIIIEQLISKNYAEVVIEVVDKEKIDEVLSFLAPEEFKVTGLFRKYPPYSIHGNITLTGLEKLKNNPSIVKIDIISYFKVSLSESIPLIKANDVWLLKINNLNITGSNITVCIVDSGVNYTHSDFGSCSQNNFLNGNCPKVIGGTNTVGLGGNNPMDDNGHGTHVTGIIAANGSINGVLK